jgi:uncharacterized surface protein with fasciclin (FAS1) repeats
MFSTLVQLIVYAGMAEELAERENMIMLCPTNDAFVRAGITASPPMLSPAMVKEVLEKHVIPDSRHRYENLREIATATTLDGYPLVFEHDENLRTTVKLRNTSACVLMQGFSSTNASFSAIGRVLM